MKAEILNKFIQFISECLDQTSDEELRVGCFLFTVLLKNLQTKAIVLLDELSYGWCIEEDIQIKTLIAPTGLTEYQIEKGLVDLVKHGIFDIHIDRKVKQVTVELKDLEDKT
jgi:hypothetical protein